MPILLRQPRRATKPIGAEIALRGAESEAPWAWQDAVFMLPFLHPAPIDVVHGVRGSMVNGLGWRAGKRGWTPALQPAVDNLRINMGNIFSFSALEYYTMWALIRYAHDGTGQAFIGKFTADTATRQFNLQAGATGGLQLAWLTSGGSENHGGTMQDGGIYLVVLQNRQNDTQITRYTRILQDGVDVGGGWGASSSALDASNLTANVTIGGHERQFGGFHGDIFTINVTRRVLSDGELLELSRDPFAPFRKRRRIWIVPSGGGGGGGPISGSGTAVQLAPLSIAGAAARVLARAAGAAQLPALQASGAGATAVVAAGAAALGALGATGQGTARIAGAGTAQLAALEAGGAGVGVQTTTGSGAATLAPLGTAAVAEAPIAGSGAAGLPALAVAAQGATRTAGQGAATLAALGAAGAASAAVRGAGAATLAPLAVEGQATSAIVTLGAGAATLGALGASGTATAAVRGAGGAALPALVTTGASGRAAVRGAGSGLLAPLTTGGAGRIRLVGLGAAALAPIGATGRAALDLGTPRPLERLTFTLTIADGIERTITITDRLEQDLTVQTRLEHTLEI